MSRSTPRLRRLMKNVRTGRVQKTLAAHEAVVGKPIDPKLLRPFEPL